MRITCLFGGYRDILLNVKHGASKFVGELQLTLKGLLEKKSQAHATYEVTRTIAAAKMIGEKEVMEKELDIEALKLLKLEEVTSETRGVFRQIKEIPKEESGVWSVLKEGWILIGDNSEAFGKKGVDLQDKDLEKKGVKSVTLKFEFPKPTPAEKKMEKMQLLKQKEIDDAIDQRLTDMTAYFENGWKDALKRFRAEKGGEAKYAEKMKERAEEDRKKDDDHRKELEKKEAEKKKEAERLRKLRETLEEKKFKVTEDGDKWEVVKPQGCAPENLARCSVS